MAILSTLLAVSEPSGMWQSIIKAFEGFTNNYVLAIILLTVIIRIIWAPIDTVNKRMSQKMAANQAKLQPELEKLKAKYANNPQLLKQKQNELYSKNNTNSVGSCVFMLIFIGLNLAIFLTLWQGLNSMSVYKTSESYENLKYEYVNCLDITNNYILENGDEVFKDFSDLTFEISDNTITLKKGDVELFSQEYRKDFSVTDGEEVVTTNNQYILNLINTYISKSSVEAEQGKYIGDKLLIEKVEDENGEIEVAELTLSSAIQNVAMRAVEVKYEETKDNFLWIQNLWIADSPLQNSIFEYDAFIASVGKDNYEENEKEIYNSFMIELRNDKGRVNGYFILPILCVIAIFLTMWLSTRKKKGDATPSQPGGKMTKIIMPLIFGLFAVFYSSIFAIYMLTGQIISALLIPLQNLILDKWNNHSNKKKKDKVEVVEYSRKF